MDDERNIALREVLRDLGWLPTDLSCQEKNRLAEQYLEATTAWLDAGAAGRGLWLTQMVRAYKASLRGEDEAQLRSFDEARLRAARARLALEAHTAAHNC
jgi:hypothetical protein